MLGSFFSETITYSHRHHLPLRRMQVYPYRRPTTDLSNSQLISWTRLDPPRKRPAHSPRVPISVAFNGIPGYYCRKVFNGDALRMKALKKDAHSACHCEKHPEGHFTIANQVGYPSRPPQGPRQFYVIDEDEEEEEEIRDELVTQPYLYGFDSDDEDTSTLDEDDPEDRFAYKVDTYLPFTLPRSAPIPIPGRQPSEKATPTSQPIASLSHLDPHPRLTMRTEDGIRKDADIDDDDKGDLYKVWYSFIWECLGTPRRR
jgi:hypothetical protein